MMKRRIFSLLCGLWLLSVTALAAYACELPDLTRQDCSIEVTLRHGETDITGGTLTAVRVAEAVPEAGRVVFRRCIDGMLLEDIHCADAAEVMEQFVLDHGQTSFQTQTVFIRSGRVCFQDLAPGVYLILQDTPTEGYRILNPFLVSLPYIQDGQYRYRITAAAKTEPEQRPESTEPISGSPTGSLPQTGLLNWPIPVLAATGLALLALGRILSRRKQL